MDLLISANTVAKARADTAPASGTPGWATDGDPAAGIPATDAPGWHYNMMMAELLAIVDAAGIARSNTDWSQVLTALKTIFSPAQYGVAPYSAVLTTLIGGYPAGAVVAGSAAGEFWVSTADANTTVPGDAGAKWKSLFSGVENDLDGKANREGGNSLTGNQLITGGGNFRVKSTLDNSAVYLGMDGTNTAQSTLIVVDEGGNIKNVLRLDADGIGLIAGSGVKVTSAVDGSYCRLVMDGSTGSMADLVLVDASGNTKNVLRLDSSDLSVLAGSGVKVTSAVDGSYCRLVMDGSTGSMADLVLVDASGNTKNVLRLDSSDLSVLAGSGVKVTSAVDGSYCRLVMDGSTGGMADLLLVNASGAIVNTIRLQNDGYASVGAGRLSVLSDRFPVQFQNSDSNASAISTSLSFTAARSGWMSLHLGSGHSGSFKYSTSSTSYSSNVTALSESQHVASDGTGSPWIGNFLYRFTAGAVSWSSTITWGGAGALSLSGIGTVYYDE